MPAKAKNTTKAAIPGFFRDHVICRDVDIEKFRMGTGTGPLVMLRSANADSTRAGLRVPLDVWARVLGTWSDHLDPERGEIGVAALWAFADELKKTFRAANPGESEIVRFITRCSGIVWELQP